MSELREGLLSTRADFVAALAQGVEMAADRGCRDLCWLDADFASWPLSEPALLDALTRWALPHRRLHLLASQFDTLRSRHPRFVQWRRRFDHVVSARQYDPDELPAGGPLASLLAPGLFSLKLLDQRAWRAVCSFQTAELIVAREWFDAVEQRAVESFAASTLGL